MPTMSQQPSPSDHVWILVVWGVGFPCYLVQPSNHLQICPQFQWQELKDRLKYAGQSPRRVMVEQSPIGFGSAEYTTLYDAVQAYGNVLSIAVGFSPSDAPKTPLRNTVGHLKS